MQIMDSHVEGLLKMPPEQCKRLLAAIFAYSETGDVPDFSDDWALDAWWTSNFPVLETSKGISSRRSEAGSRGGRPRKQNGETEKQTESKQKQNGETEKQTESKQKQNGETEKQTKAEEEEEEEEEKDLKSVNPREAAQDPLGEISEARGAYRHPTPSEVETYVAASGGHPISGADFVAWYDDHGWPPHGWQGSAMRWSRKERDRTATAGVLPFRPKARQVASTEEYAAYSAAVDAEDVFGQVSGDAQAL